MDKINVSKQGDVYRVPVSPDSGSIGRLASWDDEPAGYFMVTYVGMGELKRAFPGREFSFLEKPVPPQVISQPLSSEQQNTVNEILKREGLQTKPVTHTTVVATATGKVLSDSRLDQAQEFLKRLETAHEYASRKNQRDLSIKIAVIKELISEVFNKG